MFLRRLISTTTAAGRAASKVTFTASVQRVTPKCRWMCSPIVAQQKRLLSSSRSLDDDFQSAQVRVKDIPSKPSPDELLKLYSLFKQGTEGRCNTAQPSAWQFVEKSKWNAWNELGDMDKDAAKQEYIRYCEDIIAKYNGSGGSESSAPKSAPNQSSSEGQASIESFADHRGYAGLVDYEVDDNGVATVSIKSLTMPPMYFADLSTTFRAVASDSRVNCVLLKAAPDQKAFCYGLDLMSAAGELSAIASDKKKLHALIGMWQDDITSLANLEVPVVASINKHCIGGGVDVVTAADIRLCTADALFSVREAKIAIVADLGSLQRLPPIVGTAMARELAYRANDIDGAEAQRIGLVNHVYNSREELDEAALAMATEIAQNPSAAVRGSKNVLNYGDGKTVDEGLAYVRAWNAAFLDFQEVGRVVAESTNIDKKK